MSSRTTLAIAAVVYAATTGTACAASSIPVSGPSSVAASAVALIGLVFLAVGLSRLASGTGGPAVRFGLLGALGRFGGGDRGSESGLRRAVTSILTGIALLGLPDMFGAGIVTQVRVAYEQSRPAPAAYVGGSEITTKETSRTHSDGSGGGETTAGTFSFPLWMLGVAGLFVLIAVVVRTVAGGGVRSSAAASRSAGGGRGRLEAGEDEFPLDPDLHRTLESGGVEGASTPSRGALEILSEIVGRVRERIRILLKSAKEQLRRLADETEEQKGRFRPLAAFAVQQASALFRALADRDDGGSGLPRVVEAPDPRVAEDRANAVAYGERIGAVLSLQGADLVPQIAKALAVTRQRIEADLHRLGATGSPGNWVRVVNVDARREWILAEHHIRTEDRHFEGIVRFDHVDWFATLAVQDRPSNLGMVILPLPDRHVHLMSVRDERAEELARDARGRVRLPKDGSWTLADLPLERIAKHFGEGSDGRWVVDPEGLDDEILAFDVQPKGIVVASGADRLRRALSSEEDPVRALIHVRRGAALASLGVTITDVVPPE